METGHQEILDLTTTWFGILSIIVFVVAYALVISEEFLHLRKSKAVMVAAGVIWALVAAYALHGDTVTAAAAVRHNLLDYAELLLFLLAAMTYVNTMEERNVFNALRARLVSSGYSLPSIFWIAGLLAFFISPFADNLTTALVMAAVIMAVGVGQPRFIALACINIVVAANAGGAFSPFGDITTLMVWQKGLVGFFEFFALFVPSVINWLIPAAIMSFAVSREQPQAMKEIVAVKQGGFVVIGLFLMTIIMTVSIHHFLHMPPVNPDMSHGQWLLVTLTAGVGGSLLSIGSAAGVALMGQACGIYTFFAHFKWTWAIGLGYAASIWAHLLINARLM